MKFGKFIEIYWFVFFKIEFRMGTYQLDYYEQQRMRKLIENIIKDYEENDSLVDKKNIIR